MMRFSYFVFLTSSIANQQRYVFKNLLTLARGESLPLNLVHFSKNLNFSKNPILLEKKLMDSKNPLNPTPMILTESVCIILERNLSQNHNPSLEFEHHS